MWIFWQYTWHFLPLLSKWTSIRRIFHLIRALKRLYIPNNKTFRNASLEDSPCIIHFFGPEIFVGSILFLTHNYFYQAFSYDFFGPHFFSRPKIFTENFLDLKFLETQNLDPIIFTQSVLDSKLFHNHNNWRFLCW